MQVSSGTSTPPHMAASEGDGMQVDNHRVERRHLGRGQPSAVSGTVRTSWPLALWRDDVAGAVPPVHARVLQTLGNLFGCGSS